MIGHDRDQIIAGTSDGAVERVRGRTPDHAIGFGGARFAGGKGFPPLRYNSNERALCGMAGKSWNNLLQQCLIRFGLELRCKQA